MLELTLSHGPKLKYISYPMKKAAKVTKFAHRFLFEPLKLEDGVTLHDVFKLLKNDPVLVSVFRGNFATEYLEAVLKVKKKKTAALSSTLEYIELYTEHSFNSYTRELNIPTRYNVQCVSSVLQKDNVEYDVKKGQRIELGLAGAPVETILHLPLKVRSATPIMEDDLDSASYHTPIATNEVPSMALGTLIYSLLWTLAFHGSPKQTEQFNEKLKKQIDDFDNGITKSVPYESLFEKWKEPGIAAMFDTIGDNLISEVCDAFRYVEDSKSVVPALKAAFGNTVVVKKEFRKMPAREFRRTFRGFSH